jgi:hypothetical protein
MDASRADSRVGSSPSLEDLGNLPVFRRRLQSKIRNDVIADVEHCLDRNLQVSFSAAGEEWILEKRLLVRDVSDLLQKPHALANAMNSGGDDIGINQRSFLHGSAASDIGGTRRALVQYRDISSRRAPERQLGRLEISRKRVFPWRGPGALRQGGLHSISPDRGRNGLWIC